MIGAALGGWTGVTVAAFFAGVEFGIQPLLFKTAGGAPLYAPYPLSVAIPAMVLPHMAVASVVEGALTALVVAYLQRSNNPILEEPEKGLGVGAPRLRWVWVGLAVLAVASPLGLLAPGTAWGEWGMQELAAMGLKAVPPGLEQLSRLWGAPLADYDLPALGNASLGYVLSAVLGILVTGIVVGLFTMLLTRRSEAQKESK